MYISLSGQLGSGKSTLCAYLEKNYGFETFSTGTIHRRLAKERNLSTLEFNKLIAGDKNVDLLIDDEMKKFARENTSRDIIFDSRLAWHFIGGSFKVFLLVSPKRAAHRVFFGRVLDEEKYSTKEEALRELIHRRDLETRRFKDFYGVDCNDYNNYDFIIDTSEISTEEIAEAIFKAYDCFINNRFYIKCFVSPKNVYPLEKISEESKENTDMISLIKIENGLFIYRGKGKVIEAIKNGEKTVGAKIVFSDDEKYSEDFTAASFVERSLSMDCIAAWERENNFDFGYYPDFLI
ncbi:MAG: cytidylate kinase family protein [Clostridiales bacterium]|jgi:cytidylate kinase|nr:cytidylate kinase family protein [Clostridiales bacterium]